ncbi:MAG: hypothetical protein NCW75_08360 [Phycisphaera sp.]|nr:MAG: hypothetical protein NCW75_08360 [Phycisphaera sp.]
MSKKITSNMSRARWAGPVTAGLMLALAGAPVFAQNNNGNSETKPATQASQEGLPSVDKLAEMTVEAVGGRENIEKVKTLHTVMSMSVQGMAITVESKWSRDGGRFTKSGSPFSNEMRGTDGTTAWMKVGQGSYMLIDGAQAEQLHDQASLHIEMLNPKKLSDRMESSEVVAREEFNGRMCYKVRFDSEDTEGERHVFFDASNGMPMGMSETEQTPMGKQSAKFTLGDWKTIDGVKFFHTMTIETPQLPDGSAEMKLTTLEVNTLDKDTFALPAEVKELVANADKPAEEDTGGNEVASGDEIKLEDLPEAYRERTKMMLEQVKQAGKESIEVALQQYEQVLPNIPEGNDKLTLQYIIQELKKVK